MRQSAVRALNANKYRDFFGIHDITNKDIAGAFATKTKLSIEQVEKKYDPLLKSRIRLVNEEKDKSVVFGRIRYDVDNTVKSHGQFEESQTARLYDTIQVKQMFVPDEDGKPRKPTEGESDEKEAPQTKAASDTSENKWGVPYKISEVSPAQDIKDVLQIFKGVEDEKRVATLYKHQPPITFYFQDAPIGGPSPSQVEIASRDERTRRKQTQDKYHQVTMDAEVSTPEYDLKRPQVQLDALAGPKGARAPLHELDIMSEEYKDRREELEMNRDKFDRTLDKKFDVGEPQKPTNALQYVRKVRSKQIQPTSERLKERLEKTDRPYSFAPLIKLDSQGSRIYTDQVPKWSDARRVDIMGYLKSSIIYHNYDILAINKPYGLASHASPTENDGVDINSLMREVAKGMRIEDIYLAHRLDKTTTGVLLFATSQERARNLHKLFKSDEIKKTYLSITRGVPQPEHGVIDMPLGDFEVAGKRRTCPVPHTLSEEKHLARKFREARRAITEYRVIDGQRHVALVELKPQSGVKHQLRCHLGFGLNTPILGDHKYSHLTKLAPQILAPSVLKALQVRQSKVRTLPIHLHAKSIVIPGAKANGEMLFINAPLPKHFTDNMKALKLRLDD